MYFRTSSRMPTVVIIDSNDGVVLIRISLIEPFTSGCLLFMAKRGWSPTFDSRFLLCLNYKLDPSTAGK
jgi:hypothetical protein